MKMSIASAWTLLRVSGAHPRRPRPVDWNVRPFRGGIAGKVRILSTSPMPKLLRIPRFRSRSSAVKWGIQPRCHRCPIRSRFRDNRSCRNSLCCIGEQATRACQGEIAGHIGFGRRDICVQWDEREGFRNPQRAVCEIGGSAYKDCLHSGIVWTLSAVLENEGIGTGIGLFTMRFRRTPT